MVMTPDDEAPAFDGGIQPLVMMFQLLIMACLPLAKTPQFLATTLQPLVVTFPPLMMAFQMAFQAPGGDVLAPGNAVSAPVDGAPAPGSGVSGPVHYPVLFQPLLMTFQILVVAFEAAGLTLRPRMTILQPMVISLQLRAMTCPPPGRCPRLHSACLERAHVGVPSHRQWPSLACRCCALASTWSILQASVHPARTPRSVGALLPALKRVLLMCWHPCLFVPRSTLNEHKPRSPGCCFSCITMLPFLG